MINLSSGDSREIIGSLVNHMESKGLVFKKVNLNDSSPYAILASGTSIGYRTRSKWGKTGIVFFCSSDGVDAKNISNTLNITIDDNSSDSSRPFALFIPNTMVENAITILTHNPVNTGLYRTGAPATPRSGKNSYQSKYWDAYFPFVQQALAKDKDMG